VAVLRLRDARSGSCVQVRPAKAGLRVCAYLPETAVDEDITWLRVLLVADLLLRAAELRNLQVLTVLAFTDPGSRRRRPASARLMRSASTRLPRGPACFRPAHRLTARSMSTWSARTLMRTIARAGWLPA